MSTGLVGASPPTDPSFPKGALGLTIPADVRLSVSPEDFKRLCQDKPDLRFERTAKRALIVMAPVGPDGGLRDLDQARSTLGRRRIAGLPVRAPGDLV